MLTESQISAIECCLLEKIDNVNVASYQGRLTADCLNETALFSYQVQFIRNYVPNGTLLEEGFISSAVLDMSTITTFGVLVGAIIVDGVVIGILPEATYADLATLITAVVAAINGGSFGYTAVDNGDDTITLTAPGPGTEANGFVVTIQINPTFIIEKQIESSPKRFNQIIYIDAPTSFFDGYTVVASFSSGGDPTTRSTVVAFKGNSTASTDWITIQLPSILQGFALVYDPINDRILVGGLGGARRIGVITPGFIFNTANNIIIPFTPGNPNPTDTLGFFRAYYNATNECTYFTMPTSIGLYYQSRSILKLSSTNVQTQIIVAVDYNTIDLRINPANGSLWLIPFTSGAVRDVRIMNTSDTVTLTIAPVNYYPTAIEYYGVSGSERMMIAFAPIAPAIDFRIATYLLDGTLDNANWYVATALVSNIFYSAQFNNFFITEGANVFVLTSAGVLKQTFATASSPTGFVDDPNFNYVIGANSILTAITSGRIDFFTYTNDGSESADGALEGGTPDVFQTEADQCVEEKYVNALIEHLKAECGCEDCNETPTNGSVVPPPVTPTFLVYYGRSALTTLTNTQVEALTSLTVVTYAGSYLFEAVIPSTYCYVAYPASLGTPTRIYDQSTGFDVAVEAVFQVTINSVIYNVYDHILNWVEKSQITFAI